MSRGFVGLRNSFTSILGFSFGGVVGAPKVRAEELQGKDIVWNANWDLRDGQTPAVKGVVHTILLVRHGQYENTHQGNDKHGDELTADSHRILTTLGREQAAITGDRIDLMVKENIIPPIDSIYYSTMSRATETYQCLVDRMSNPPPLHRHQPCSLIREGAVHRPDPPFLNWQPSDEEFSKDSKRVEAAFANLIHRPDKDRTKSSTTLIVCHGNVIRYLFLRALQYNPAGWSRIAVYNASITRIDIRGDGHVTVYNLGDVGHLPPSKISYS